MKIGVRAHDFGCLAPEDLAARIAEAGFETVQLALTKAIAGIRTVEDVTPPLLDRIRKSFAGAHVGIGVLGCYIEPALQDKENRLRQVEIFRTALGYAKELGVSVVGTETTTFPQSPELPREQAYALVLDSVQRMTEKAEALGVNIGIEPVASHTLHTAALTRRLLDEVKSERLRVIFDPVNLLLTEEDAACQEKIYAEFFALLGDKIAALHVKDVVFENGKKVWRPLGEGVVRFEAVFKELANAPADLPVLREEAKPEVSQQDITAMKKFVCGK